MLGTFWFLVIVPAEVPSIDQKYLCYQLFNLKPYSCVQKIGAGLLAQQQNYEKLSPTIQQY